MSAITFTGLNFTGVADADDVRAAKHSVLQRNIELSRLDPPGSPLPLATNAELKASYLSILLEDVGRAHLGRIGASKIPPRLDDYFSRPQIEEIIANLVTRSQNGEDPATIVTDTAS